MANPTPKPEVMVPRWDDATIKPERWWNDHERAMVTIQKKALEDWEANDRLARGEEPTPAEKRRKAREARESAK